MPFHKFHDFLIIFLVCECLRSFNCSTLKHVETTPGDSSLPRCSSDAAFDRLCRRLAKAVPTWQHRSCVLENQVFLDAGSPWVSGLCTKHNQKQPPLMTHLREAEESHFLDVFAVSGPTLPRKAPTPRDKFEHPLCFKPRS